MKVPVVMITASASIRRPRVVSIPLTSSPSARIRAHVPLQKVEIRLRLDHGLHPELVSFFVALGPRRADAWTLVRVQGTKLNASGIGIEGHHASQGIDLPDHVPFGQTAHSRVTGHLADGVKVLGQDQGPTTQSCGGHGRFNTGVASAHHQDLVPLWVDEHPGTVA